jgi:hypothetical protein
LPIIVDAPTLFLSSRDSYLAIAKEREAELHGLFIDVERSAATLAQKERGRVIDFEAQEKYFLLWEELRERMNYGDDLGFDSVLMMERQQALKQIIFR